MLSHCSLYTAVLFCAGIDSTETECTDRLTVKEGDRHLLSLCGEKEDSLVIESDGAGLDVFISIRSKNIFPKRGVLFQYKGTCINMCSNSAYISQTFVTCGYSSHRGNGALLPHLPLLPFPPTIAKSDTGQRHCL
jgi:hypothetical protein